MTEAVDPQSPAPDRRKAILIGCGVALAAGLTALACAGLVTIFALVQLGNSLNDLFEGIATEVEAGE